MREFIVRAPRCDWESDPDEAQRLSVAWELVGQAMRRRGFVVHEPPEYDDQYETYTIDVPDEFADAFERELSVHPFLSLVGG